MITWTNSGLLEKAKERFTELEHKGWDWGSFYNGFLEGVSEALEYAKANPFDRQDGNSVAEVGENNRMETVNLSSEHPEEKERDK